MGGSGSGRFLPNLRSTPPPSPVGLCPFAAPFAADLAEADPWPPPALRDPESDLTGFALGEPLPLALGEPLPLVLVCPLALDTASS
ncbi:MAG TPA: hypothetical protein VN695_16930, partial [Streptosporangiaceae bacterium]|nr:hypothetical protein [Streptosporangiaceae bacterium]